MLIDTTSDAKVPASSPARGRHRWHAVTIAAPAGACAAALACKGKRYLSSDAPKLPLTGCDGRSCACKYGHFADRRGPERREYEKAVAPAAREPSNRRVSRGRRTAD